MKKVSRTRRSGILALVLACMLCIPFGLSTVASAHYMEAADGRYVSDYADMAEAHSAGRDLNQQIMEESMALLKNENQTLPLGKDIKNISVFGKHSVDFSYISKSNPRQAMDTQRVDLQESLRAAGYNLNPVLEDFYRFYEYEAFEFNHPEFNTPQQLRAMLANNNPYSPLETVQNPIQVTATQHKVSVLQPPVSEFDDFNINNSMKKYSDAALIVLGNRGSSNFLYSRGWNDSPTTNYGIGAALATYSDPSDNYNHLFELTKSERDMIDYAADRFENVIVLINSAESWDISDLKKHAGVDSIIHTAVPGTDGILALGKILNGEVNPSGRTVNMYLNDTTKSPQWQNQGTGSHLNADAASTNTFTHENFKVADTLSNSSTQNPNPDQSIFHEYEEGIYIGSKYFETRGWEMGGKTGDWDWYDKNVVYPLGHGLSYTDFKWEFAANSHDDGDTLGKDDTVTVKVKVTNTGKVAGKDVVELYYTAPYTPNGVEKAFVNLKGFEKTKILQPGQSQVVSISLKAQDMASYDWNNLSGMGKNSSGTWGHYALEEGDYQIRLMRNSNVRSEQLKLTLKVPASGPDTTSVGGYMYDTDVDSGNPVENHFTVNDDTTGKEIRLTAGLTGSDALRLDKGIYNTFGDYTTVFTRAQFGQADTWLFGATSDTNSTFPTAPDATTRKASDAMYEQLTRVFNPTDAENGDVADQPWMKELAAAGGIPADWTQAADTSKAPTVMFKEMAGRTFDDVKWEEFLNQLTIGELYSGQIAGGAYGNGGNERIGMPRGDAPDGAHGLQGASGDHGTSGEVSAGRGTVHPEPTAVTMTWNKELMYLNGRQMGTEARLAGANDLYTLTFDLRRHHYEARTWEGCSEDPFLIGTRGMMYVRGSQDVGTIVQIKHFAMFNGMVKANSPTSKLVTEQALREMYLEPFRMGATPNKGGAMGIMTSYGRIGIVSALNNYSLLTRLTKNEWGFAGWIVSDMQGSHASQNYNNGHLQLRAGMDQFMGSVNANVAPIWDATLRSNKGGVKLTDIAASGTYAGITGNPESAIQYYRIRQGAKRIFYAAANTNILSYSATLYKDAIAAWGATGTISATQNVAPNLSLALTSKQVGDLLPENSIVSYRLAYDSALPLGMELTLLGQLRQSTAGGGDELDTVASDNALGAVLRESSTKPFTFEVEMLIDNQVHAKKTISMTMNSAFQIGTYDPASTDARPAISDAVNMSTPYTNLKVGNAFTGRIQGVADNQFYVKDANPTFQNAQGVGRNTVYTVVSGSFPLGMTLNTDGTVTGTPTVAGQYDFTIKAHRMIRTISRGELKTENLVYYIHSTMAVAPAGDSLTSAQVQSLIDASTGGFLTETQVNNLIAANAEGYLTNATATTLINSLVDAKGFQTAAQVSTIIEGKGHLTGTQVQALIDTAVAGKLDTAAVNALITAAVNGKLDTAQVNALIATAMEGTLTEADVQKIVDEAIVNGGGCGGAITSADAISAFILVGLALAGACLVFLKRKKKA